LSPSGRSSIANGCRHRLRVERQWVVFERAELAVALLSSAARPVFCRTGTGNQERHEVTSASCGPMVSDLPTAPSIRWCPVADATGWLGRAGRRIVPLVLETCSTRRATLLARRLPIGAALRSPRAPRR
jgi:hypothetical protein